MLLVGVLVRAAEVTLPLQVLEPFDFLLCVLALRRHQQLLLTGELPLRTLVPLDVLSVLSWLLYPFGTGYVLLLRSIEEVLGNSCYTLALY